MVVTRGKIFNWEDILSYELKHYVEQAKIDLLAKKALKFYMSTFLLDGIFARYDFTKMHSNWTPREKLHVYSHCIILSGTSFRDVYDRLVENFIVILYQLKFEFDPPCKTNQVKEALYDKKN